MTQPTSWAELQHQLLSLGGIPVLVTPQNAQAARDLQAKGLARINIVRRRGQKPVFTVKLKEQSK